MLGNIKVLLGKIWTISWLREIVLFLVLAFALNIGQVILDISGELEQSQDPLADAQLWINSLVLALAAFGKQAAVYVLQKAANWMISVGRG